MIKTLALAGLAILAMAQGENVWTVTVSTTEKLTVVKSGSAGLTTQTLEIPSAVTTYTTTGTPTYVVTTTIPIASAPVGTITITTTVNNANPTVITKTITVPITKPSTNAPMPTLVYKKSSCAEAVICPAGSHYLSTSQECLTAYYNGAVHTSTCELANCCSPTDADKMTLYTTCRQANIECPYFNLMLTDINGYSSPCSIAFEFGKIVNSSCTYDMCCNQVEEDSFVHCNKVVTCALYKANPKNGHIKKCMTNRDHPQSCNEDNCCNTWFSTAVPVY